MNLLLAALLVASFAGSAAAFAAERYPEFIAHKGIALSRVEKSKVIAYDPVAAFNDRIAVADCTRYETAYRGVTWCFESDKNLNTFVAQETAKGASLRDRYLPMFGGRCSYGVSNGKLTPEGDPRTALRIHFGERAQDARVFLNGSMDARANFLGHTEARIASAQHYWWAAQHLGLLVPNDQYVARSAK